MGIPPRVALDLDLGTIVLGAFFRWGARGHLGGATDVTTARIPPNPHANLEILVLILGFGHVIESDEPRMKQDESQIRVVGVAAILCESCQ